MGFSSILGAVRVPRPSLGRVAQGSERVVSEGTISERSGPVLPMIDFDSGSVDGSDDGSDPSKLDQDVLIGVRHPSVHTQGELACTDNRHCSLDSNSGANTRPPTVPLAAKLQSSISSVSTSSSDFPTNQPMPNQAYGHRGGGQQTQRNQPSAREKDEPLLASRTDGISRANSPAGASWTRTRSSPPHYREGAPIDPTRQSAGYFNYPSNYPLRPPTSTVIAANPDAYPLYDAMETRRVLQHHRTRSHPRALSSQTVSPKLSGAASAAASSVAAAADEPRPTAERHVMARQLSGSRVMPGGHVVRVDEGRGSHSTSPVPPSGLQKSEKRSSSDNFVSPPERWRSGLEEDDMAGKSEKVRPFAPSISAPCLAPAGDECLEAEMWEARDQGGFPSSVSHCEKPERSSSGGRRRQIRRPPPLKTPVGGVPGFSLGAPDLMDDAKRIATYCPPTNQPPANILSDDEVCLGVAHSRASHVSQGQEAGSRTRRKLDGTGENSSMSGHPQTKSMKNATKLRRGLHLTSLSVNQTDSGCANRTDTAPFMVAIAQEDCAFGHGGTEPYPVAGFDVGELPNGESIKTINMSGTGGHVNLRQRADLREDVDPFGFEEASQTSLGDLATQSAVVRARNGILPADPEDPLAQGLANLVPFESDVEEHFVFGRDGRFTDAGFVITAGGVMKKPDSVGSAYTKSDGDAPLSSNMDVPFGSLDEFEKGPTLGSGAHGCVYLARHRATNQKMAVKVINVYDHSKRKQLVKELRTLLSHNNRYLVRSFGAYYESGYVKVTLEYMDRGALSDVVEQHGEIAEPVVRHIARDCLAGLLYLHKNRALHRDFKTANILLSRRAGAAKLSDFGLVRDLIPGASTVQTFVGTLAYMSPERLHGSGYTYASDVWGLGISLLECILGRYPFEKPASYFDYLDSTKMSPCELVGDRVSKEMLDFVSECTRVEPTERATVVHLLNHPWLAGSLERAGSQRTAEADRRQFVEWLDGIGDVAEMAEMNANLINGGNGRLPRNGRPSTDFFRKPLVRITQRVSKQL